VDARALGAASIAALSVVAAARVAPAADAARSPRLDERVAITRALPAWLRKLPVGCVRLVTVVSRDGGYATVTPQFLVRQGAADDPCLRYAGNGYFVLRKRAAWRVLGNRSDPPSCGWHVPRDLAATCLR
jgi:hypothetical protein